MAAKSSTGGGAAGGHEPRSPADIRNVVLVGPPGSGKTTLVESLLASTSTINRSGRVEDGTTVSDYDEAEIRQGRSVGLAVAPLIVDRVKINVLDTPGYADFVGELRAGLRAADCALFVIAANEGVDSATRILWDECRSVGMPRCVVISKLDHQRADYMGVLAGAQQAFGDKVLPLYVPLPHQGSAVDDLVALLSQTVSDYSDYAATGRRVRPPDGPEQELIDEHRGTLIEGVIEESEDEGLMDRYMDGEVIDVESLVADLETAVARGTLFPVVPMCALSGQGLEELLEVMRQAFPPPSEHPLPAVYTIMGKVVSGLSCDPDGPLLAEVVKSTSDPYVGRVSLVRIFSGTLQPDATVHVSGHDSEFRATGHHEDHDEDERVGAVSSPLGRVQRPMNQALAGDICAIARLSRAETGDTLSEADNPLVMEPWSMPEPLLPVALVARAKTDEDKLGQALRRLAAEDPTVWIEHQSETHQLVLWCLGESHADVLLDRLSSRHGVQVDQVPVKVPLRETLAGSSGGLGRHVKQSGGHGQFAVCHVEAEPLATGSGFEFVDKVVGGSVPRQFIPSVEKGVRAQLAQGLQAGYPVVDVRVTLLDGKAHSVDSSDMAFQTAGALALRDAAATAGVRLLEPIDTVDVIVEDGFVGAVMADASARRAHVLGTEPVGLGRTIVKAEVPQLELLRYATDLRSFSHGTGSFSRSFARYDVMPPHVADRLRAAQ